MSSPSIYLVTGANRGLGKGITAAFLARDSATVIAAVRNASSATPLSTLPKGKDSKLIVVEIDSASEGAPAEAIKLLQSEYDIKYIDTVIANAGICNDYSPIAKVDSQVLSKHVEINAYGSLFLFQAVLPLLENSSSPKFVAIGSPLGSIGGMESRPLPVSSYGISKAALHYILRKIHQEHANITAFPVDPGFVQTDLGNNGAVTFGMKEAIIAIDDSVKFIVSTIDAATKEKTSGHFPSIEGGDFAW